jgi:Flp pilus assembly protein CpaB
MKSGSKLFIFTGVALALVTVLLAITMTSGGSGNKANGEDTKPDKVKVVKAATDFEPHKVIAMSDILVEEMPSDQVPADAATDTALVLGQAYKLGAVKGDILLNSYLETPGITSAIEAGKRAVAIELDSPGMMSGLIMDCDYVDLVFNARVDLQKVLQAQGGVEVEEDGPYGINQYGPADPESPEDNQRPKGGVVDGAQQLQGAPGSEFTVKDAGGNLEPVTKMIVQDIKVIRVVQPGVKFDAQGQQVSSPADASSSSNSVNGADKGQLILEVTPQQAEAISFMQDQNHKIEVVIRGKDDHELANTTGITFQILMTDGTWSLPWPAPIQAPEAKDAKQ